jgi:hypothetical protein
MCKPLRWWWLWFKTMSYFLVGSVIWQDVGEQLTVNELEASYWSLIKELTPRSTSRNWDNREKRCQSTGVPPAFPTKDIGIYVEAVKAKLTRWVCCYRPCGTQQVSHYKILFEMDHLTQSLIFSFSKSYNVNWSISFEVTSSQLSLRRSNCIQQVRWAQSRGLCTLCKHCQFGV